MRNMNVMNVVIAAAAVAVLPLVAHAHSEKAAVGRAALLFTPLGAFAPAAPVVKAGASGSAIGLQVRYSRWQFADDDDNTTNIGGGLVLQRGGVRTLVEIGRASKKECKDCDNFMFGVDVNVPVFARNGGGENNVQLSLNPAFGYGKPTDSGNSVSALAAALSVPMSASLAVGPSLRLMPFISPGFGFGRLSFDGGNTSESETGSRAMVSGGVALAGATAPIQLTLSARRILNEGGPTVYGVAFAFIR